MEMNSMNSQRIELDISSDIFDRVVAFLKLLPQNKIKFKSIKNNLIAEKESISEDTLLQSLQISSMDKTWDNIEDKAWNEI